MLYIFLSSVLVFTAVNNYLLFFSDLNLLPTPIGFNIYAKIAHTCIILTSIWQFGWLWGLVFLAMYFLNVFQSCITWIFNWFFLMYSPDKFIVSRPVYNFFANLVGLLIINCIVSFFIVDFEESKKVILRYENLQTLIIISLLIMIVGFVTRIIVIKTHKEPH